MTGLKLISTFTFAVISFGIVNQSALALTKDMAQACMQEDLNRLNTASYLGIERAISGLQFKSEIFYQLTRNRLAILDSELFQDYLNKDEEQEKREDAAYGVPAGKTPEEQYERLKNIEEVLKGRKTVLEKKKTNAKSSIEEIESNFKFLAPTNETAAYRLEDFLKAKSLGDRLIDMAKKATSCDDLHSKYVALLKKNSLKNEFDIDDYLYGLSGITDFRSLKPDKNSTKITETVRELLKMNGYRRAASEYTYNKNSSLGYLIWKETFGETIATVKKEYRHQLKLGPKDSSAEQIEKLINDRSRPEVIKRHTTAMKTSLQFID